MESGALCVCVCVCTSTHGWVCAGILFMLRWSQDAFTLSQTESNNQCTVYPISHLCRSWLHHRLSLRNQKKKNPNNNKKSTFSMDAWTESQFGSAKVDPTKAERHCLQCVFFVLFFCLFAFPGRIVERDKKERLTSVSLYLLSSKNCNNYQHSNTRTLNSHQLTK